MNKNKQLVIGEQRLVLTRHAAARLQDYLKDMKRRAADAELYKVIESRVAELLKTNSSQVIDLDAVESAMRELGSPDSLAESQNGPRSVKDKLHTFGKSLLQIIGIPLVIVSVVIAVYGTMFGVLLLVRPKSMFDAGQLFPVGVFEYVLLVVTLAALLVFAFELFNVSWRLVRRQWSAVLRSLPRCLIGLGALTLIGLLSFVYIQPRAYNRYRANQMHTVRAVADFQSIHIAGGNALVTFDGGFTPGVTVTTAQADDASAIKTDIRGGVLYIDTTHFASAKSCNNLCIHTVEPTITVASPHVSHIDLANDAKAQVTVNPSTSLTASVTGNAEFTLTYSKNADVTMTANQTGARQFYIPATGAGATATIRSNSDGAFIITNAARFTFSGSAQCAESAAIVYLKPMPAYLQVNGQRFTNKATFAAQRAVGHVTDRNCMVAR